MASSHSLPSYTRASDAATQRCPKCGETAVAPTMLTHHFVSLRCSCCAEVWVILERRKVPRENTRAAQFPLLKTDTHV